VTLIFNTKSYNIHATEVNFDKKKLGVDKNIIILAGGFGTRLRSTIGEVPKPLAQADGKPFLHLLIKNIARQGGNNFVISLFHCADIIKTSLSNSGLEEDLGIKIQYVLEESPLGTGGAIAFAVKELSIVDDFLVINGDTWVEEFLDQLNKCQAPTLGVLRVQDTSRYGTVQLKQDKVTAFEEKNSESAGGWINSGVYFLNASDFHDWDGNPCSIEEDLLPLWSSQKRLSALRLETQFIDIGIEEDYHKFCDYILHYNNNNPTIN